jgi:hypothetical protein
MSVFFPPPYATSHLAVIVRTAQWGVDPQLAEDRERYWLRPGVRRLCGSHGTPAGASGLVIRSITVDASNSIIRSPCDSASDLVTHSTTDEDEARLLSPPAHHLRKRPFSVWPPTHEPPLRGYKHPSEVFASRDSPSPPFSTTFTSRTCLIQHV